MDINNISIVEMCSNITAYERLNVYMCARTLLFIMEIFFSEQFSGMNQLLFPLLP